MTIPPRHRNDDSSRHLAQMSLVALLTGVVGYTILLIAGQALLSGVFLGVLLTAAALFAFRARHLPTGKTALWGCAVIFALLIFRLGILYKEGREHQQDVEQAREQLETLLEEENSRTQDADD